VPPPPRPPLFPYTPLFRSAAGGPAVTAPAVGRGLAFGDLFNDGGIGMVVSNNNGPAMLLRNNMPRRHWVELSLRSQGPNGEAIRSEEHTSELQSPCNLVCR